MKKVTLTVPDNLWDGVVREVVARLIDNDSVCVAVSEERTNGAKNYIVVEPPTKTVAPTRDNQHVYLPDDLDKTLYAYRHRKDSNGVVRCVLCDQAFQRLAGLASHVRTRHIHAEGHSTNDFVRAQIERIEELGTNYIEIKQ